MSGISMIQNNINNRTTRTLNTESSGKEIWLKDGDQVFMKSIASGDEGDIFLDEFFVYEFQSGVDKSWKSVLVVDGEPVDDVPSEAMYWEDNGKRKLPRHKFALWVYVTEILHAEKRDESWEEITSPTGNILYKEVVNDFKVITLSFGANNINWNQLVDVYGDNGALNKSVIRVKRRGSNLDTTYTITSTNGDIELPEDKQAEVANLTPIKEYVAQRYGKFEASDTSVPANAVTVDDEDDDMPF